MERAWKKAQKDISRLESIPEYNVAEDLVLFEKWRQGKFEHDKNSKKWLENLKRTKERGVKIQRVRIVSLPFSDYIKYEINFWKHSIQNGEEILFLENKEYEKIVERFEFIPKDFWIFDDKTLIIFHYDKRGDFVKEEPVSYEERIKKYLELKKKLLNHALPMKKFLKTKPATENRI